MALPKIIKAGGGERGQFILREFNDNTVRFVLNYPGIVVTAMCTIGAVGSARYANKVSERKLNLTAGTVLILVSAASLILS